MFLALLHCPLLFCFINLIFTHKPFLKTSASYHLPSGLKDVHHPPSFCHIFQQKPWSVSSWPALPRGAPQNDLHESLWTALWYSHIRRSVCRAACPCPPPLVNTRLLSAVLYLNGELLGAHPVLSFCDCTVPHKMGYCFMACALQNGCKANKLY